MQTVRILACRVRRDNKNRYSTGTAATTPVMCLTARIRISCENYPDPKSFCLRPPQQAKGQQRPKF